jgi:hypothetical protein
MSAFALYAQSILRLNRDGPHSLHAPVVANHIHKPAFLKGTPFAQVLIKPTYVCRTYCRGRLSFTALLGSSGEKTNDIQGCYSIKGNCYGVNKCNEEPLGNALSAMCVQSKWSSGGS